jgi:hypothetical protein
MAHKDEAHRNERNERIVRRLEIEANQSAATYIAEVEAFARESRLKRMADLLEELTEWMEEEGDLDRLQAQGVELDEEEGLVRFVQGARKMTLCARDDMSIKVDGKIMYPNPDCPVLDDEFYVDVMARVYHWAGHDENDGPRRCFE